MVKTSMFKNNQASYGGGIRGETANIFVSDSQFHDNNAAYYAGAIYVLVTPLLSSIFIDFYPGGKP